MKTPPFKVVQRSAYAEGPNYMKEIVEYRGQSCYTPTSGMCFFKCINCFTEKHFTEEFSKFIRSENIWSGVMTPPRIQPFCRKYDHNIGFFDGKILNPSNITERNTLFIQNNRFCLFRKSNDTSFEKSIKELKLNFKVIDIIISDKHGKSFLKYDYNPEKVQSPVTNIIVYHLQINNKDGAVPYCGCFYKLSKLSGIYNRDIIEKKSKVFKWLHCFQRNWLY